MTSTKINKNQNILLIVAKKSLFYLTIFMLSLLLLLQQFSFVKLSSLTKHILTTKH